MSLFIDAVIKDSNRCLQINPSDIEPLPKELGKIINADDHYLFQTYIAADADLLITSDKRLYDLRERIAAHTNVNMQLRDEFLSEYIKL